MLEQVFDMLEEAVFVVQAPGEVIYANRAAKSFLKPVLPPAMEVFFTEVFLSETNRDEILHFAQPEGMALHCYARYLSVNQRLIVARDVTRVMHLEDVRRDFVANVSHELKTPITSIKGFVETLLDGALDNREDSERFLHIISRQADRLNTIFEDLLTLSSLEHEETRNAINFEEAPLLPVIEEAIQNCARAAQGKAITIKSEGIDCEARINARLLEQAISNLIDNAIKYSGTQSVVKVLLENSSAGCTISVVDQGCGIGQEHRNRIWERFYRVDEGRSRKKGGTGLGLAIVKHIAQVHGGKVSVKSEVGQGSAFSIELPKLFPEEMSSV